MPIISDVVVGLQHGDEGKGKVTNYLIETATYNVGIRFSGGPNAGHTIYKNGEKIVTHHIPVSIVEDMICIIGPCCVIDIEKLEMEIQYLEDKGINVRDKLRLSFNTHLITPEAIQDDIDSNKVGTTKCGIGPTYSRKMLRTGKRVIDFLEKKYSDDDVVLEKGVLGELLGCQVVDIHNYLNYLEKSLEKNGDVLRILFEGAQGCNLDIDWGDYPYVTSSSCITYNIFSCGVPITSLNRVYGVAKIYDTYVGKKKFMPDDQCLLLIQQEGKEFGSTTGRPRQCNWLNMKSLKKSINLNNVNTLIINKCDIIKNCGVMKIYSDDGRLINFNSFIDMELYINEELNEFHLDNIIFSCSPNTV